MPPVISIITVCRNEEKNIEKTLKSVQSQSFKEFEHIIIDGKSEDETLNIIKKYKNENMVVISEADSGIYDAMNKGIETSNGEFLLFLNAGDCFEDEKSLEKVMNQLDESADIIYTNAIFEDENIRKIKKQNQKIDKFFFYTNMINHQSLIVKRTLLKAFNTTFKIAADYDWLAKVCFKEQAKLQYIDTTFTVFQTGGVSTNEKYAQLLKKERAFIKAKYLKKHEILLAHLIIKTCPKLAKIKPFSDIFKI